MTDDPLVKWLTKGLEELARSRMAGRPLTEFVVGDDGWPKPVPRPKPRIVRRKTESPKGTAHD
jgi:hypothetical protein